MSVLGIGVDVLNVARLVRLYETYPERLAARILSSSEASAFRYLQARPGPDVAAAQYLATRFVVKEAAYKALFPLYRLSWKMLSIRKPHEKPLLTIEPLALDQLRHQVAKRARLLDLAYPRAGLSSSSADTLLQSMPSTSLHGLRDAVQKELAFLFDPHQSQLPSDELQLAAVDPADIELKMSLSHDGDVWAAVVLAIQKKSPIDIARSQAHHD